MYDSLWRIAERRLGDGGRWPEIWALNKDLRQADGRVFTNPHLIQPGWELHLPAPASTEPPANNSTQHDPPLHFQVLGRLHLTTRADPAPVDLIDTTAPRQREILVHG